MSKKSNNFVFIKNVYTRNERNNTNIRLTVV